MNNIDTKKYVPPIYQKMFYYAMSLSSKYTDFILKGGRGSLKSSIAALIVVLTVYLGYGSCICIRRYQTNLRKSCRATIIQTIKRLRLEKYFEWSKTPNGALRIVCTLTGKTIDFEGLDDPDKLKSYAEDGGIAVVWFEECQMIENYLKIENAIKSFERGEETITKFIFCYNPKPFKNHWCNKYFTTPEEGKFILHTSYLDVPRRFLGEKFYLRAEKVKNRNYEQYLNEYMGEVDVSIGKVFRSVKNISIEELVRVKSNAEYIERGLDLGFSNAGDPTAYSGWVIEKTKEALNLYCVFGHQEKGMKIPELASVIRKHNKHNAIVYSDSMPAVVDSLIDDYGLNIEVAYKHNMREIGFYWLSTEVDNIYICEELNPDVFDAFANYVFKENKDGEANLSQYPKEDDHYIDSCRYALEEYIRGYVKVKEV